MNPWHISRAVSVLRAGGVIAYPTEAVWGLGCDPYNRAAVNKLLQLKRRSVAKGLILVSGEYEHLAPFLAALSPQQRARIEASWPGFQTWVVPDDGLAPSWIKGDYTGVALRLTSHPGVSALTRAFGRPIVSTSANITGRPVARDPLQLRLIFGDGLNYLLPGALGGEHRPSSIRDILSEATLRSGG